MDLPLLPLRDVVVFPHMVIPLFVGRPKSIKALEAAMEAERRIMLVAQKAAAKDEPSVSDMFEVGCISTILQMLKLPDGTVKVLVEGQQRARVAKIVDGESHFVATVSPVDPAEAGSVERLARAALATFLHPLQGGPDRQGWPPGRGVFLSDVAAVLERVPGLDAVDELALLLDGQLQGEQVAVPPDRIVVAGTLRIKVV